MQYVVVALVLLFSLAGSGYCQEAMQGKTNTPDFPKDAVWLNTDRPLTMQQLRGKIVLLDFWTYCCINCMHVLPDLRRLEYEYPELVVVGVHSAKFTNEQDAANIREAILRYDIQHPVIVDNQFYLWKQYAISAWPSFRLIDPEGKLVALKSGEGVYDWARPLLDELLKAHEGKLNTEPLQLSLERSRRPRGLLAYPGKVAADPAGKRLFVSDANHNRILELTTEGKVQRVIGSGMSGSQDGPLAQASFLRPQGLAYHAQQDALYVADTENHLIRKVDLKTGVVTTVLGSGQQAQFPFPQEVTGRSASLASPWDVALQGSHLYIAMAGMHQIWRMHLDTYAAAPAVGTADENMEDGPALQAMLAQPSGLAVGQQGELYFVDSESSSLRVLKDGQVKTLIGEGLFDFGDIDGTLPNARLQHAIGVTYHQGKLYIADTYNHKIKIYDPATAQLRTLAGTGYRGYKDAAAKDAMLNEPNGLVWLADKLYITDTNNDLIRRYDPKSGYLGTMALQATGTLSMPEQERKAEAEVPYFGQSITVSPQKINVEGEKSVELLLQLPRGYKLNKEAPNYADAPGLLPEVAYADDRTLVVRMILADVPTSLQVEAGVYFCESRTEARCFIQQVRFTIPLEKSLQGKSELTLKHVLQLDMTE